ncbi:MAG: class I SAM-dependent methyltransferase [Actinobacteria bacterium]|nr:class I SAM-dependent methyltransferase [Actinomycetota bacterium]
MPDQATDPPSPGDDAGAGAHTSAAGSWSWRVKTAYARGARAVGRALVRVHVLPDGPPPRDERVRHWLYSLPRIHDALAIADLDVPWWTYSSIDEIEAWLDARDRPIRVFEWGSGASTVWLASRADQVHSVEHHPAAIATIAPRLATHDTVTLLQVPAVPSPRPRTRSRKLGSGGLDFTDYVHAIDDVPGDFDLIVIDGRAREACLDAAIGRLAADGLIVFDNTYRRRYRQAVARSDLDERVHRGLTPTLPYPDRTSLLTRPDSPSSTPR